MYPMQSLAVLKVVLRVLAAEIKDELTDPEGGIDPLSPYMLSATILIPFDFPDRDIPK